VACDLQVPRSGFDESVPERPLCTAPPGVIIEWRDPREIMGGACKRFQKGATVYSWDQTPAVGSGWFVLRN